MCQATPPRRVILDTSRAALLMPKENYHWLRVSANFDRLETIDPMTVAIHL